jgi:hypothetical protein
MRQREHIRVLKQLIRLGAIEFVFLVLGILGAGVRTVIGDTSLIWRHLGAPPGKAIRIVDGDYLAVRVQTVSGDIYFCRFNSPNQCWIHNDHPSYSPYTYDSPRMLRSYREPPSLPGVVDTRKFYTELSEYDQVLSVYAITENGEVYVWQDGLGDPFDFLVYLYEGIPVALLCGFVFWGFVAWRAMALQKRRRVA